MSYWDRSVETIVEDALEGADIISVLQCNNPQCVFETTQEEFNPGDSCLKCGNGTLIEVTSIREAELLDVDELPPVDRDSKEWHHEKKRIETMSQTALHARIYKTAPAKLVYFMDALEDENYHDLAELALKRLDSLGYKWDYDLNTYVRKIHKH